MLTAEMDVRRMLAGTGHGKTENTTGIGILVRQPGIDQPVEDTVKRNPVKRQAPQSKLDLVMRKRRRRATQQLQDPDACRSCPRTAAPDLISNRITGSSFVMYHNSLTGNNYGTD